MHPFPCPAQFSPSHPSLPPSLLLPPSSPLPSPPLPSPPPTLPPSLFRTARSSLSCCPQLYPSSVHQQIYASHEPKIIKSSCNTRGSPPIITYTSSKPHVTTRVLETCSHDNNIPLPRTLYHCNETLATNTCIYMYTNASTQITASLRCTNCPHYTHIRMFEHCMGAYYVFMVLN